MDRETIPNLPPGGNMSSMSTPSKTRSMSNPQSAAPTLAPSPTFQDKLYRVGSKDDHAVPTSHETTPSFRRTEMFNRGLTLQMPPNEALLTPSHFPPPMRTSTPPPPQHFPAPARDAPLSPQLDRREIYMQHQQQGQQQQHTDLAASPATSLPRHSRGLDFSRASTTLHHSMTLQRKRSPESSPVISQKGMAIPGSGRKGSVSSMMLDSPNIGSMGAPWGHPLGPEKSAVSSSVGSVNMFGSESEGSESEDASMAGDGDEDAIFATPQVHKLQNPSQPTPFAANPTTPGAGGTRGREAHFSPAQASLMKTIRRTRLQKGEKRGRKSSSSASGSGYSSMASPRNTSPPPMRSIENNGGLFTWSAAARSRRESLALGTEGVPPPSSGNDSGDEASPNTPSTPGVVRRPVTRRGNLLPKTKGFARIRAALAEEATPIDTEVRRECETMKQVHERDGSVSELDLSTANAERPGTGTGTAASSPNLLPAVPESTQENFGHDIELDPPATATHNNRPARLNIAAHASRNSGGLDYWHRFDPTSQRTPPPNLPASFPRQGSSVASDINMDSDAAPSGISTPLWRRPRARSSASDASEAFSAPFAAGNAAGINDDVHIKKFKRRREDDFDIATVKRRAVSPGMPGSAQNSPVLTHSPGSGVTQWGAPPERREGGSGSGSGSGGGGGGGGKKKLGLQGMTDTNDGLMKMSIE